MKLNRYICAATSAGAVNILDVDSLKVIKTLNTNNVGICDMDARNNYLVTCGWATRPHWAGQRVRSSGNGSATANTISCRSRTYTNAPEDVHDLHHCFPARPASSGRPDELEHGQRAASKYIDVDVHIRTGIGPFWGSVGTV